MAAHTADVNREMVRGKGVPMLGLQPNDQIQGSLVSLCGFIKDDVVLMTCRFKNIPALRWPTDY